MKVIIVGGVAGGASCAARLRRLDEKAEILVVERGPYVSYANCGLPYHVGGVIPEESSLLLATEQTYGAQGRLRSGCRGPIPSGGGSSEHAAWIERRGHRGVTGSRSPGTRCIPGWAALRRWRDSASASCGCLLDFVVDHTAPDHPWAENSGQKELMP